MKLDTVYLVRELSTRALVAEILKDPNKDEYAARILELEDGRTVLFSTKPSNCAEVLYELVFFLYSKREVSVAEIKQMYKIPESRYNDLLKKFKHPIKKK